MVAPVRVSRWLLQGARRSLHYHNATPPRAKFPYIESAKGIFSRSSKGPVNAAGRKRFPHNLMDKIVLMRKPLFLRPIILVPALTITAYLISRIETVPLTGLRRLKPIPDWLAEPFFAAMDEVLLEQVSEALLPTTSDEHKFVADIVDRFKKSHASFLKKLEQENKDAGMPGCHLCLDDIRFRVVASRDPNASCTGGGLVLVNTALLELLNYDADKIALVIGHELGHYVAQHTSEAIGHTFLAFVLNKIVSTLLGKEHASPYLQSMIDVFFMLPKSRSCEIEADYIGLIMAARACFNIRDAHDVWFALVRYEAVMRAAQEGRMATQEDVEEVLEGNVVSETMSTHPMFKSRIKFYDPDGEWMEIARNVQRAQCGEIIGAPKDVHNPLLWWLQAVRPAYAPPGTIFRGDEDEDEDDDDDGGDDDDGNGTIVIRYPQPVTA
ncbi:hypothetical protein PTSG_05664 [Salpingoeca rosetta]|uniref:Peptidase M48 domain-containing protein n=1 Tax=Salpingoeca rosetta (strain ATCC 50818 / BSB-021) TaxID=946362 RepID=F2UBV4_SALR5|nr:uncharacterized protein PTSG_05664 [Salpingoeca rosetta]EGD73970.1 hypothetical protein PTSG_05664 [Salpingoeca rosetta]|eukprot:XP_004993533.1 hypothetical protein PTSG_05664 [Salpingoeca rosetta]